MLKKTLIFVQSRPVFVQPQQYTRQTSSRQHLTIYPSTLLLTTGLQITILHFHSSYTEILIHCGYNNAYDLFKFRKLKASCNVSTQQIITR